jgi:hypothetical protein
MGRLVHHRRSGGLAGLMIGVVLVFGCSAPSTPSGGSPPSGLASAVTSAGQLRSRTTAATAFVNRYHLVYGDPTQLAPMLTESFVFFDPNDGDYEITPRASFVEVARQVAASYPSMRRTVTATLTATDRFALEVTFNPEFWPPFGSEPTSRGPVRGLEVFGFRDDLASSFDTWTSVGTMQAGKLGCYGATASCGPDIAALEQRYTSAWSSGDRSAVAALYRADASLEDSVLGLRVTGARAIAATAAARFGSQPRITVLDSYIQTAGPYPPASATDPQGQVIAVAVKYRAEVSVNGLLHELIGLATLELGTRTGGGFDRDPNLGYSRGLGLSRSFTRKGAPDLGQ